MKAVKTQMLSEQLQSVHQAWRWGNLTGMSSMFSPKTATPLSQFFAKKLQTQKITDFAVVNSQLSHDQSQCNTIVSYTFIHEASQNVGQGQLLETWEYNKTQRQWQMVTAKE